MSKRVVILEDDPGYESLLRNVAESRGWQIVMSASYDELAASIDWADAAIIDLDATGGPEVLRAVRDRRKELPLVAVVGDETATAESTGADAVIQQLPVGLVEVVNDLTAPAEVIDLTERAARKAAADRPWYVTS
jgi:DNA-binding NtrC family response regulator